MASVCAYRDTTTFSALPESVGDTDMYGSSGFAAEKVLTLMNLGKAC